MDALHAGHRAVDIRVPSKHHESRVRAGSGIPDAILTSDEEGRIEVRSRTGNREVSYSTCKNTSSVSREMIAASTFQ